jgi:argininosuccinate synthase
MGVKDIFIRDVREEFVRDFVFPMFRANTVYEGTYLLGTSIARPLISKHLVEIARKKPAPTPWRMARPARAMTRFAFELSAYALEPRHQGHRALARLDVQVPHRPDDFAREAPDSDRQGQARRCAVLGRRQPSALLVRGQGSGRPVDSKRPEYVHQRTISPMDAPDAVTEITISFKNGDPVALNGKALSPGIHAGRTEPAWP